MHFLCKHYKMTISVTCPPLKIFIHIKTEENQNNQSYKDTISVPWKKNFQHIRRPICRQSLINQSTQSIQHHNIYLKIYNQYKTLYLHCCHTFLGGILFRMTAIFSIYNWNHFQHIEFSPQNIKFNGLYFPRKKMRYPMMRLLTRCWHVRKKNLKFFRYTTLHT